MIGITVLVTVASTDTSSRESTGTPAGTALVEGFELAFRVGVWMLMAAAVIALLIGCVRAEPGTIRSRSCRA